ncbi:hypothetical protein N9350_01155 [Gammaproteobacteria bacterium]|nr:hypothetical protein [Gammaproteobacteria bacterium]
MAMTGGIGQQLDQLKGLSIQELMQRQSVDPQLVYALALQEKQKMEAAKERQASMGMEVPQGTEVEKMEADLASRRAPGVQIAAQRSMPQPQMAQGIAGVPSPNMGAVGRAQGGIIGYAKGGMPEVGAKSKGPIPRMSPEENAMALKYLEGLKKFDYLDKNPDKVSPEGRQALELERRMFEEQFPNAFRQKINEMMYGPSKGMAMGGEVKGYAGDKGSTVSSDNVAMPYMLGGKYYVDGKEINQTDYEALLKYAEELKAAQLVNRGAFDENDRRPPRPFYAPGSQADRMFSGIRSLPSDLAGSLGRMGAIIGNAASRDVGRAKEALSNVTLPNVPDASGILNSQTPQGNRGGGMAPAMQQLIDSLGPQDYSVTDEERRATKEAESAAPAPASATSTPSDRSLNSMAGIDEQALRTALGAAMQTAEAKRSMQGAGQPQDETPPVQTPPKEGGIRSALSKTKPFLDKAMGIAEVLGRGAGASKGFEGAKIVEESRKLRESQAERDAKMAEQKALIDARKAELDAKLASDEALKMQELDADLYATIKQDVESGALSEELAAIEQSLKDKYDAFSLPIFGNIGVKEDMVEKELAAATLEIIKREFKNRKGVLASLSGMGGQGGASGQGASETIVEAADFFPG